MNFVWNSNGSSWSMTRRQATLLSVWFQILFNCDSNSHQKMKKAKCVQTGTYIIFTLNDQEYCKMVSTALSQNLIFVMYYHVSFKCWLLRKPLMALFAFKRLLSSVDKPMSSHICFVCKAFPTKVTLCAKLTVIGL